MTSFVETNRVKIPKTEWDHVVLSSPEGFYFALSQWLDQIIAVPRWGLQDYSFGVFLEKKLIAVVPLQWDPIAKALRSSGWGWCGPIFLKDGEKLRKFVFDHIEKIAMKLYAEKVMLGIQGTVGISLCKNSNISETFFERHIDKVDWSSLCYNTNISETFLNGMDGVARQALQKYMNKKITGQTNEELVDWLKDNVSAKQYKTLVGDNQGGYLHRQQKGLTALFTIWNAIYALKVNLADQLEQQVQGIKQSVNGKPAGEGFVFNTPQGLVKLVNRGTFSAALFAKE